MKKRFSRLMAILLSIALMVGSNGVMVFADETSGLLTEDILISEDILDDSANLEEYDEVQGVDLEDTLELEGVEDFHPLLNYHEDEELVIPESKVANMRNHGVLPSSYRSSNLPTARNQNPYGTCWTFSTIGSSEGSMIKQGYSSSDIDLAERQLCYFFNNRKGLNDPLGNTAGDYNELLPIGTDIYEGGGNKTFAAWHLTGWAGPVYESDAPYSKIPNALDASSCYGKTVAHLQDTRLIPDDDRNGIKQAIMDNNIVGISYYHSDATSYWNRSNHAYYRGVSGAGTNHAVSVVGWDDNFSKDKFNSGNKPASNGAWLIRNSWGSDWEDNGYFWISYEEPSLHEVESFRCEPGDNYDNNYFYDGASGNRFYGYSTSDWNAANIFKADSNELLKAVSIGLYSSDVNYEVQIYKNPDANNPSSGTAMLSVPQKGTTSYAGYYTIPLDEPVPLATDDTYAVVFKLSKSYAYVETTYQNGDWIHFVAATAPGQSFCKVASATSWNDASGNNMCFRIHAFTDEQSGSYELNKTETNIKVGGTDKLTVTRTVSESAINDGFDLVNAKFKSSADSIVTVDESGNLTGVGEGSAYITASAPDGCSLRCDVTVSGYMVKEISVTDSMALEVGTDGIAEISFMPKNSATDYIGATTITLSDNKLATISDKKLKNSSTISFKVSPKSVTEKKTTQVTVSVESEEGVLTDNMMLTVYPKDSTVVPAGAEILALVNNRSKLSDYAADLKATLLKNGCAPDAWSFAEPNTILNAYDGVDYVMVPLSHINPYTKAEVKGSIPVYVSSVTGLSGIEDLPSSMMVSQNAVVNTVANVVGYDLADITVRYSASPSGIVTVNDNVVTAVAPGKATITANAYYNGVLINGVKPVSKAVTVVGSDKPAANIKLKVLRKKLADGSLDEISLVDDTYTLVKSSEYEYYVEDEVSGTYMISYASSDTNIIKASKSVKGSNNLYQSKLVPVKSGYVYVTATANDTVKTNTKLRIRVLDSQESSVALSKSVMTFNSKLNSSTDETLIYNGFDATIESASLVSTKGGADTIGGFGVSINTNKDGVIISRTTAVTPAKGYVKATLSGNGLNETYYLPVTLNVKQVMPKVIVKQRDKVAYFYKGVDGYGSIDINVPGEKIVDITVIDSGKNGRGKVLGYEKKGITLDATNSSMANIQLGLKNGGDPACVNATLEIKVDGYNSTLKKDIKIATNKISIAPDITSGVLLTNGGKVSIGNEIRVRLNNKTSKTTEEIPVSASVAVKRQGAIASDYVATVEDDTIVVRPRSSGVNFIKADKVDIIISAPSYWSSDVTVKNFSIKPQEVAKLAVELKPSTLTMSVYGDTRLDKEASVSTQLSIKGGNATPAIINNYVITGVNPASSAVLVNNFNIVRGDSIIIDCNGKAPAEGTYKFKVTLPASKTGLSKDLSTVLTVKVKKLNLAKAKIATAKVSGKLDAINRTQPVNITPKFSNLFAGYTVENVRLTGNDKDLFEVSDFDVAGNTEVKLSPSSQVFTNKKYTVNLVYTVRMGESTIEVLANDVKLTVTQGKIAVKTTGNSVLSNTTQFSLNELTFVALDKDGNTKEIESVICTNLNQDFEMTNYIYGPDNAKVAIKYTPNGNLARGKAYTLKFKVYVKDRAGNASPVTVNYKVTIQK